MNTPARRLWRTPGVAVVALVALALGLAAVGSMFALVYGVLLAPLPYRASHELVGVALRSASEPRLAMSPAVYEHFATNARTLAGIGIHRSGNANVGFDGGASVERVAATWMSPSLLDVLDVRPLVGRSFDSDEVRGGGRSAVLLGERIWRERFGGSPAVLGQTIVINEVAREIVGVLPDGFAFPSPDTRVWLPARLPGEPVVGDFFYAAVARLAPGVGAQAATRELDASMHTLAGHYPRLDSGGSTADWLADVQPKPVVRTLRELMVDDVRGVLWMLAAAAALVLLVAWANVANLLLVRADTRRDEVAVRAALGASRARLAGDFFAESAMLCGIAAVLASALSYGAVQLLVAHGPADLPRLSEVRVGAPTLLFILCAAALGSLVCAALPMRRARAAAAPFRNALAGSDRSRLRTGIAALQIGMAFVVAAASAVLLRTASNLARVDPGFDATSVTVVRTQLPFARYDDEAAVAFYRDVAARVRALPFVRGAALSLHVPLGPPRMQPLTVRAEGASSPVAVPVNVVDPAYFATMAIPIVAGENLRADDRDAVMLSRAGAVAFFGNETRAVGKRLSLGADGPTYHVVGVVGDVRDQDLASAPVATIYRPHVVPSDLRVEPPAAHSLALLVKSDAPAVDLVEAIRAILRERDPGVPLFDVEPLARIMQASTARLSLVLTMMSAAAATTLVLGLIGLYGLLSYTISRRTREIGLRMALGAPSSRVRRAVAARGLAITATGIAIGCIAYAAIVPLLRGMVYGVEGLDLASLVSTACFVVGTATLAMWLPARRAARIDPASALRSE